MSNYEFVRDEKWVGKVKIYRHKTHTAVGIAISRAYTFDQGDETMIFPYDLVNNRVADWGELYSGHGESHTYALKMFEEESND